MTKRTKPETVHAVTAPPDLNAICGNLRVGDILTVDEPKVNCAACMRVLSQSDRPR